MKQKNKFYNKKYAHFDIRKNYSDYKKYIENPKRIKSHGFYPFIRYEIKFVKYNSKNNSLESKGKREKTREIMYSSHIDRYIYKYYSELLNEHYNIITSEYGINEASIAYRNNMQGKSNINFAKEVIDFIRHTEKSYIIVGDFEKFFNNLNHKYLKDRICDLLKADKLPDDHYAVYKNITKYSWIELDSIEKVLGKSRKKLNKKLINTKLFQTKEFHGIKKQYLKINKTGIGIPQGSSISALYANTYMLDFDREINNYVKAHKGIYRRYCDDFIVVIPINNEDNYTNKYSNFIFDTVEDIPNLTLSRDKTKEYLYEAERLTWNNSENLLLDYLGFSFNGKEVRIREKSITKFYYKLHRKINRINKKSEVNNRKCLRRGLYRGYSHLGAEKNKNGFGNFITYANRSQKIFDENSFTDNKMKYQVKNHWKTINNKIIKKKREI